MKTTALRVATWALFLTATAPRTLGSPGDTPPGLPPDACGLTLERIFSSEEFAARTVRAVCWLPDSSGFTTLEDPVAPAAAPSGQTQDEPDEKKSRDLIRYRCPTGTREVLVDASHLIPPGATHPLRIDGYSWSADARKLLIFTNAQRVWRQNTRGDYWVLDLASGDLRKLGGDAAPAALMFAKFAPNGRRVAYVRQKNLYVQDLESLRITPLTQDGSDTIINGTSDWVYKEEFGVRDGFRWSPDGQFIAYWHFDTNGVPDFSLVNCTKSLYPEITTFKYPKVGQTNPACRIGVVPVAGGPTRWLDPGDDPRDNYVPRIEWIPNSRTILLERLNRLQNRNRVLLGQARTGRLRTILTEQDEAWVEVGDNPKWLDNGKAFVWLSERDGWRHLYLVSRSGRKVTLLTPGEFDVLEVAGLDQEKGWVYYLASPANPTQRYLWRAPLGGEGRPERITPADQSGTHEYTLSPDAKWAVHTHSSMDKPPVIDLIRLPDHVTVQVLQDNDQLRAKLEALRKRPSEFFRIDIGDRVLLDGWCMKPPDFSPQRQYPLLFHVYGEPAGSTVRDKWAGENYLWHTLLAQRGYLVVSVDNRGTAAPRGRAWRKSIYRQVGILASADQAAATRALIKKWPYVDPNRIGVWGWSGGGSMSLNAIFRYPDLYHTAMAIAFVSNQRFYDTVYQERYMGLPQDNEEGYQNGSPITFAHQLKGHLLLVYGTSDDNCHYQNCAALIDELVKHNKQFSMMAYPNRSHSLKEGENTRRHLYELLTRYLIENLPSGPSRPRSTKDRPGNLVGP
jgi:dipeptidyl-peptidase-4